MTVAKRKQSPAERLRRGLQPMDDAALQDIAKRAGVPWVSVARARSGQVVNASAHLRICAAAGIDPRTGAGVRSRECADIIWWFFGAALFLHRIGNELTVRDVVKATDTSLRVVSFVESAKPVSAESYLKLCRFIDRDPYSFTCDRRNTQQKQQVAA